MKHLGRYLRPDFYKANRRRQLILVTAIALFALILLILRLSVSGEGALRRYYDGRLGHLHSRLEGLPENFEPTGSIDKDLGRYESNLADIRQTCQQLDARHPSPQVQKAEAKLKKAADNTLQLCKDLKSVTSYSTALYSSLGAYLTLEPAGLPAADSPEFPAQLSQLKNIISRTLSLLQRVNTPAVEDPGLDELIVQVESAEKLAADAQTAHGAGDVQRAGELTARLTADLAQDKTEFMHARHYFWNNTVQLDSLLQAIAKLQDEFRQ